MNYAALIEQDLEIGSGMVEGAIKILIGKRCDHGGMRRIKERAEAVVQLRCIEANGDWEAFISSMIVYKGEPGRMVSGRVFRRANRLHCQKSRWRRDLARSASN